MADDTTKSGDTENTSSTRGGAPRRGGFGDDQGTRVGRPDTPQRDEGAQASPSTRPVKEGLEGAILEDSDTIRGNG